MIISAQNECIRNRFGERRSLEMMKEAAEIRDLTADVGPFNYEITTWYRTFSDALLPEALALSVKAAAPMMRIIEGKE